MGLDMYISAGECNHNRKPPAAAHDMYWRKANWVHRWFIEKCNGDTDNGEEFDVEYSSLEILREVIRNLKSVIDELGYEKYFASGLLPRLDMVDHVLPKIKEAIDCYLPISENGFFFGYYDHDWDEAWKDILPWYYESLQETLVWLNDLLDCECNCKESVTYYASW